MPTFHSDGRRVRSVAARVILATTISGVLAFALIDDTKYALVATLLALLAAWAAVEFGED